jgi:hypothetical protein
MHMLAKVWDVLNPHQFQVEAIATLVFPSVDGTAPSLCLVRRRGTESLLFFTAWQSCVVRSRFVSFSLLVLGLEVMNQASKVSKGSLLNRTLSKQSYWDLTRTVDGDGDGEGVFSPRLATASKSKTPRLESSSSSWLALGDPAASPRRLDQIDECGLLLGEYCFLYSSSSTWCAVSASLNWSVTSTCLRTATCTGVCITFFGLRLPLRLASASSAPSALRFCSTCVSI